MRLHCLSACCVILLTAVWCQAVLALPQHSSNSSTAQHERSTSVPPAASDDASGGASTFLLQPAQQQQWQRAAQTIVRHGTEQPSTSAQRSLLVQTQTAESGPLQAGVQHLQLANRHPEPYALRSHSHPSQTSAEEMAAHTVLSGQQAPQGEDAHARHVLLEAAQLSQPRPRQQAGAGFGRRVIDSGPALEGGVRFSTAELMAAGASSLSDGQASALAAAAQREEGADSDSQEAAESSSASVATTHRSQVMAAGLVPSELASDEQVQPQRSGVSSAAALEPAGVGRTDTVAAQSGAGRRMIPQGLGATIISAPAGAGVRKVPQGLGATLTASAAGWASRTLPEGLGATGGSLAIGGASRTVPQGLSATLSSDAASGASRTIPQRLGVTGSSIAAGGTSRASNKGPGASFGAAEVAPGEDAWWRRVRQDPEQCGIVNAAPSTVLRSVDEHAPDACGQLCRCEDMLVVVDTSARWSPYAQ